MQLEAGAAQPLDVRRDPNADDDHVAAASNRRRARGRARRRRRVRVAPVARSETSRSAARACDASSCRAPDRARRPTGVGSRSTTVTGQPSSEATAATSRPMSPPPTTPTRGRSRSAPAGRRASSSCADSGLPRARRAQAGEGCGHRERRPAARTRSPTRRRAARDARRTRCAPRSMPASVTLPANPSSRSAWAVFTPAGPPPPDHDVAPFERDAVTDGAVHRLSSPARRGPRAPGWGSPGSQ